MVPSKLRNVPPEAGSLKLSELVTLNASKIASTVPPATGNGLETRMSQEKNPLSRRMVFRCSTVPSSQIRSWVGSFRIALCPDGWLSMQLSEVGCAE